MPPGKPARAPIGRGQAARSGAIAPQATTGGGNKIATGYWAVFVTMASELFGTNIRATVTTTAPNFVRGAVVPLTFSFKYLKDSLGVVGSAIAVGVVTLVIAAVSLLALQETYGKNLDYVEE